MTIRELLERPDWMQDAACRGLNPNLFFPKYPGDMSIVPYARQVCASCPVRQQCLDTAIANGEPFGVFGGHTVKERRQIAAGLPPERAVYKNRRPIDHGSVGGYNLHLRRGEEACRLCLDAHASYKADYKRRKAAS